ncbi:MAG TPA: DNA-processing protein DprA [Thermoanaerobaculia bacterium]|nr:DNA-processing protein DprA [Thermoanaerobaculia bacterium]
MHETLDDLLIALNADPVLGRSAACRLGAAPERWLGVLRRSRTLAEELGVPRAALVRARKVARRARDLAGAERALAARAGARVITRRDPAYPRVLFDLSLPPAVLYVGGELPGERTRRERTETEAGEETTEQPAEGPGAEPILGVAVVGSRRASSYGLEAAEALGRGLSQVGVTVISGLAPGVDAAAHRGALAAGGCTVAVLGCGLGVGYPRINLTLRRRIAREGGAVVSEFPWHAEPRRWHFPVRNRVIAALALGTVVVQATVRSGSLITAGLTLDLGREVLALPGSVFDPRSQGPHALLRDGATPVTDARDVLEAVLGPSGVAVMAAEPVAGEGGGEPPVPRLPGLPGKVLAALPVGEGLAPEEVAEQIGKGIDAVLGALLELELEGRVRREPGPRYSRRKRSE